MLMTIDPPIPDADAIPGNRGSVARIATEQLDGDAGDDCNQAVTVVFNLVQPLVAVGRALARMTRVADEGVEADRPASPR